MGDRQLLRLERADAPPTSTTSRVIMRLEMAGKQHVLAARLAASRRCDRVPSTLPVLVGAFAINGSGRRNGRRQGVLNTAVRCGMTGTL